MIESTICDLSMSYKLHGGGGLLEKDISMTFIFDSSKTWGKLPFLLCQGEKNLHWSRNRNRIVSPGSGSTFFVAPEPGNPGTGYHYTP